MRLKAVLLQGEQSKCVFAAMPGIGVESLCVAAAEWSEGLALSSAGHCLSLLSPELGKAPCGSAWDTGTCWGASGMFVLGFSPAGLG